MARQKKDLWLEERACRGRGFGTIAGIDEAGRGPLAGPVVAGCVVLPFEAELKGVRDSKAMTHEQREKAFELIYQEAIAVGIGVVDPATIDRLNILRATHHAMRLALEALTVRPDVALIDGLPVQPFPIPQVALVKGDARSASVAAASIVAKVTRDRIMVGYDAEFPQYGFAGHKGYPTAEHLARLEQYGPCAIHRASFGPVARFFEQPALPFDDNGRRDTGDIGQCAAEAHLKTLGWELLASRYHCREGEVDIVARDGGDLVFVEVKARRGAGAPAEAVTAAKRRRLVCAAQAYVAAHDLSDAACRFDVAEVRVAPDDLATVRLIRAAFLAGE